MNDAREDVRGTRTQNVLSVSRLVLRCTTLEQSFICTKLNLPIQHTPRSHLGLNDGCENDLNRHISRTSPVDSYYNGFTFVPEHNIVALLQQVLR